MNAYRSNDLNIRMKWLKTVKLTLEDSFDVDSFDFLLEWIVFISSIGEERPSGDLRATRFYSSNHIHIPYIRPIIIEISKYTSCSLVMTKFITQPYLIVSNRDRILWRCQWAHRIGLNSSNEWYWDVVKFVWKLIRGNINDLRQSQSIPIEVNY